MSAKYKGITFFLAGCLLAGPTTLLAYTASPSVGDGRWWRLPRLVTMDIQPEAKPKESEAKPKEKEAAKLYVSRVSKEDGTVTIKDNVPSENDLKVLQGVVAATLPGLTLVDRTRVVAEVEDRDLWLAGMTYALRQLAKLERGRARLTGNVINIEGTVKAEDAFAAIQQKLFEELPKGLTLQSGLKPPPVKPFVWYARIKSGRLDLSGHVPTDADQTSLLSHVKYLFQDAIVENAMASASGAPADWIDAAKVCVEMLSLLQNGSVTLQDRNIRLDGISVSQSGSQLLKAYTAKLPKGFKLEANVSEHADVGQNDEFTFAERATVKNILNP